MPHGGLLMCIIRPVRGISVSHTTSETVAPWHQVAFLDCYTMRFVPPPDAAAANTSALPPLPLQYSLGADKVCS